MTYKIKSKSFRKQNTYNHLNVYAMDNNVFMRVLKTIDGIDERFTITVKQFTKNVPMIINDEYIMNELSDILGTPIYNIKGLFDIGMYEFKSHKTFIDIGNVQFVNGLHANKDEREILKSRLNAF